MEYSNSPMEKMVVDRQFWGGKRVFLTGHTGFKGGWIAHWLSDIGASVHGFSLEAPTIPNFFTETDLKKRISSSVIGDIRNPGQLTDAMNHARPEVVIHMAAQPLVREAYKTPVDTFATNVLGTVNLLDACRKVGTVKAIVNITTDKCYENREWIWAYRENDRLGGYDPYSSSKACAEIATAAYRNSFLAELGIQVATVRAGNVVGGGDWADDRLIPDFLRALDAGKTLQIRSPNAIRPWQHVLEPLSGYLMLAEKLVTDGAAFSEAWNFGPDEKDAKPVAWIVEHLCNQMPGAKWEVETVQQVHEAGMLKLDSARAKSKLGWSPRWNLEVALTKTIEWHQAWRRGEDMAACSIGQIQEYEDGSACP